MLRMRDLAGISMDLADILPGFDFSELKNSKILKQIDGDWKIMSCHGNIILLQV